MTQDQFRDEQPQSVEKSLGTIAAYYALLDLPSNATLEQIRRAYRQKSKLYHPDTTVLPSDIAVQKFRDLNKAYDTLSNAEHRAWYDKCSENSPFSASTPGNESSSSRSQKNRSAATWPLDPTERPLSGGELFALFLLGITFLVCLAIAIILGVARGEMVLHASNAGSGAVTTAVVAGPSPRPLSPKISPRNDLAHRKSVELRKTHLGGQSQTLKPQKAKRPAS